MTAKAELVILGNIRKAYDGTARDAGMNYDVQVDKVLKAKWDKDLLHFRSSGRINYGKYTKGERVLLFLQSFGRPRELLQLKPALYISKGATAPTGRLELQAIDKCLEIIADRERRHWGKTVEGLRVSIKVEKAVLTVGRPFAIRWAIKNVGTIDRAIIWHTRRQGQNGS